MAKARLQIEFYLGDANLTRDHYLQRLLARDSQLDISLFLTFNRVKKIVGAVKDLAEKADQI